MEKTASEREEAWVGFLPEIVALPTNGEDSSSGKLFFLPDFIQNPEQH